VGLGAEGDGVESGGALKLPPLLKLLPVIILPPRIMLSLQPTSSVMAMMSTPQAILFTDCRRTECSAICEVWSAGDSDQAPHRKDTV
jgi:hypothetical protein